MANAAEIKDALRTLWLVAEAAGGTVRVLRETMDSYPGDKVAVITSIRDSATGDLIVKSNRAELEK